MNIITPTLSSKWSPASLQGTNEDRVFHFSASEDLATLVRCLYYYKMQLAAGESLPWLVVNHSIPARLQNGPNCGLVALRMVMESLNIPKVTEESLLESAKQQGFSFSGEMFSSESLALLGRQHYPSSSLCESIEIPSNPLDLLFRLLEGQLILIPYDAAGNHQPGLFHGHKAHWAIIKGFICLLSDNQINDHGEKQIISEYQLYLFNSQSIQTEQINKIKIILEKIPENHICVITQQSKSKYQAIWSYTSLIESNKNLEEADPSRNKSEYLLPDSLNQLKNRVIVIKK